MDLPDIVAPVQNYASNLDFPLETSKIGDSEMQHLDFAYASSLIRHYMQDPSLVLTIRGRKYTPKFAFFAGRHQHYLEVESVQTEVDAGYEGREQIVLIEAKNSNSANVIIRQLYYPYRQWQEHTRKKVKVVFFERRSDLFYLWEFDFAKMDDYNSINLVNSARFRIVDS